MTTTLTRTIETAGYTLDGFNQVGTEEIDVTTTLGNNSDEVVSVIGDKSFTLETLKKLVSDAEYVLLQSKD